MQSQTRRLRWPTMIGAAVLSASLIVGCSSSKKDSTKTNDTTASSAVSSASGPTKACSAWLAVDKVGASGPGGENGPPSTEQMKQFAQQLKPLVDGFVAAAPSEAKTNGEAIQTLVNKAASTGDASAIDPSSATFGAPLTAIESWVHDSCGFQNLEVMGVDYAFEDLPTKLKSGPTSIQFMNHATDEEHEIAILRVKPGSGVTSTQLVAALKKDANAAQQQYGDKVEFAAQTSAPAGKTAATTVDLQAGDYVAVCFIPLNGTDTNVPHAQKGMVQAFTVS